MNRRRPNDQFSLIASPLLVGAVTVLITVVAVFLSYNANQGLPFVPTYDVNATVPDAAGLVRGNEVRIGGLRVGIVKTIRPIAGPGGHPVGRLLLQLDKKVEPIRSDTTMIVRPRSPLGLKYLELEPGKHGKPLPRNATLPLSHAKTPVELTDVLDSLDAPTRTNLRGVLRNLGDGFAGRGIDFNAALADAPELTRRARSVMASLAAPSTNLSGLLTAADRTLAQIEPVTPQLARLLTNGAITAQALDRARPELGQSVEELPGTELSATRALAVARPVLADADGLMNDLHRGAPYIVPAASRLHAALARGVPALRHTTGLACARGHACRRRAALARPGGAAHARAAAPGARLAHAHARLPRAAPDALQLPRAVDAQRRLHDLRGRLERHLVPHAGRRRNERVHRRGEAIRHAPREPVPAYRGARSGRRVRGGQRAVPVRPADRQRAG